MLADDREIADSALFGYLNPLGGGIRWTASQSAAKTRLLE
jgi:hypothetical protein